MQWTFLPNPNSKYSYFRSGKRDVGHLSNRRQVAQDRKGRLFFYTSRIIFLWVAIHLAESSVFPLINSLNRLDDVINAEGILIPETSVQDRITWPRLLVPVYIHQDNLVKVGAREVELNEIPEALLERFSEQPRMKVKLIIDQRCEMEMVYAVIAQIQLAGFREIIFITSTHEKYL